MQKKYFILVIVILFIIGLVYKFQNSLTKQNEVFEQQSTASSTPKIDIAVSIYPLAHFVQKVGGTLVNLHLITPAGTEPHDYEPTPADIITIESSKALVYNGADLDPWADRVSPELAKKGMQVLKMTDHVNGSLDPHIWLDPVLAQRQVENIVQLLISLDPTNRDVFEANATVYLAELSTLDSDYQNGLANCELRDIVSSHDAFYYLGRRYNIMLHPIAGVSPEDDPSPARLAELARFIKTKNIRVVFFESLISPQLSETLAQEVGVDSAVLDPIEGITEAQAMQGKNYDVIMRENLDSLKKAMVCR